MTNSFTLQSLRRWTTQQRPNIRVTAPVFVTLCCFHIFCSSAIADHEMPFQVTSVRGHVVWFADALEQVGIGTVADARDRTLAIQTDDGRIIPMIETLRARAFRVDERLREMHVELIVRQYKRTPALSVLKILQIEDGKKYRIDYWCDVCAIVMYESGPCSCCQDDNRLRRTPLGEATETFTPPPSSTNLP